MIKFQWHTDATYKEAVKKKLITLINLRLFRGKAIPV